MPESSGSPVAQLVGGEHGLHVLQLVLGHQRGDERAAARPPIVGERIGAGQQVEHPRADLLEVATRGRRIAAAAAGSGWPGGG